MERGPTQVIYKALPFLCWALELVPGNRRNSCLCSHKIGFVFQPSSSRFVLFHNFLSVDVMLYLFSVKHSGNLSFDDILNIAKAMRERSMSRKMEGTVKEILGTCQVPHFCIFYKMVYSTHCTQSLSRDTL